MGPGPGKDGGSFADRRARAAVKRRFLSELSGSEALMKSSCSNTAGVCGGAEDALQNEMI